MKKFLSRIQINNQNIFKNKKNLLLIIHELSDKNKFWKKNFVVKEKYH